MMDVFLHLLDLILHLDVYMGQFIRDQGALVYDTLFLVVFVETGLVFLPFLPGDSLLFVAGAFAAQGSLELWLVAGVFVSAAILGDTANYWIGHYAGQRIMKEKFLRSNSRHIDRTRIFFQKYGGTAIVIARFVPIARTFAPFLAGVGKMSYRSFSLCNVAGALAWVTTCLGAGFLFGTVPFVSDNFSLFMVGIVALSLVPILLSLRRNVVPSKPGTGQVDSDLQLPGE